VAVSKHGQRERSTMKKPRPERPRLSCSKGDLETGVGTVLRIKNELAA
jgi:hypothetical protein